MFQPLSMGTNFLFGQDNLVPLVNNNFEIRIFGMDGSNPTENADLLTLSTAEIGEISEDQDTITVHYGNGMIKFPSKVSFNDVDWTLNCYCEPNVAEALIDWKNKVFDASSEKMGLPSEYMRLVYFIRYDGQGNQRSVLKCPGVWIKGISYGTMNQEGGSLVQIKVTLVISKAEYIKNI